MMHATCWPRRAAELLVVLIAMLAVPEARAQATWNDFALGDDTIANCDGGRSALRFAAPTVSDDGFTATLDATVDGRTETFTLDLRDFNPGTFDLPAAGVDDVDGFIEVVPDAQWRAFYRFVFSELGCVLPFGPGGEGALVTANPVVSQNLRTFTGLIEQGRATPREAGPPPGSARQEEDDEGGTRSRLVMLREVSSDAEYEFFEAGRVRGTNLALRGGYAQTSGSGRYSYGVGGVYNRLALDGGGGGGDGFSHGTVTAHLSRAFSTSLDRQTTVGLNASYLFVEGESGGFGMALHSVQRWQVGAGGQVLAVGAMAQYVGLGDLATTYLNGAVLYGFPIGRRLALNLDALVLWSVDQRLGGEAVEQAGSAVLVNPGASLSVLLGPSFGLILGAKTLLLAEAYSSFELTLGAGFRF